MNKQELYKEVMKLAPYEQATGDYRQSLSDALKNFSESVRKLDKADRAGDWDANLAEMDKVVTKLNMEWVIKNDKVGVYYTTTHLTKQTRKDFDYPSDKFENLALPIKSPLERETKNCPVLASMFYITAPANYEIETLKHGINMDMGNLDADQRAENYRTSTFGVLESYLCDEGEFELKELK